MTAPLRRLLMVAYHFPPLAGSSGIQRTLRFVQHLPHHGWEPLVLTAGLQAYERTSDDLLADVPTSTVVKRAFALDTARHLSFRGRYLGALARPDRWVSWKFDACRVGMQMIRRLRPQAIWSTYPIATAHLIGAELARRSGLPWIADFRDPMAQEGYPEDPAVWAWYRRIESMAMQRAALNVFTTPGAARLYAGRYPDAAGRIALVENGYDEESFAAALDGAGGLGPLEPGCFTLLHSGIVYPNERDPTQLFDAVARLRTHAPRVAARLRLRFRAAQHDGLLRQLAGRFGIDGLVHIVPPIPYREALREMAAADGLLVLQSAGCNDQIPAKIYEYLRAGRPILCLSDERGDTATSLRGAGVRDFAPLDDAPAIATALERFVEGSPVRPDPQQVAQASRRGRAGALAALLERLPAPAP